MKPYFLPFLFSVSPDPLFPRFPLLLPPSPFQFSHFCLASAAAAAGSDPLFLRTQAVAQGAVRRRLQKYHCHPLHEGREGRGGGGRRPSIRKRGFPFSFPSFLRSPVRTLDLARKKGKGGGGRGGWLCHPEWHQKKWVGKSILIFLLVALLHFFLVLPPPIPGDTKAYRIDCVTSTVYLNVSVCKVILSFLVFATAKCTFGSMFLLPKSSGPLSWLSHNAVLSFSKSLLRVPGAVSSYGGGGRAESNERTIPAAGEGKKREGGR